MKKQTHDKGMKEAFAELGLLISYTRDAIVKYKERGDAAALAQLIFQQRHNLKVLFHKLEKVKREK
jgi:hypothetical protein